MPLLAYEMRMFYRRIFGKIWFGTILHVILHCILSDNELDCSFIAVSGSIFSHELVLKISLNAGIS